MRWTVDNGVISELLVDGTNLILPWGIETADSSSFFSMEGGVGWRVRRFDEETRHSAHEYYHGTKAMLTDGMLEIVEKSSIVGDTRIVREARLRALSDCLLMDFVVRFRFKQEMVAFAEIGGREYRHENTNINHQYDVDSVVLHSACGDIRIRILSAETAQSFKPVIYVRDSEDCWVVHVRMIPVKWEREVIKLCTKIAATRPLPYWMSDLLLRNNSIREGLWYRGERLGPYRSYVMRRLLNPAAFPLSKVHEGETLGFVVELALDEEKRH